MSVNEQILRDNARFRQQQAADQQLRDYQASLERDRASYEGTWLATLAGFIVPPDSRAREQRCRPRIRRIWRRVGSVSRRTAACDRR